MIQIGFITTWKEKEKLLLEHINRLPDGAVKINLGAGGVIIKGFENADCYGDNYSIKCDMNIAPYPFKDNSVDFILCNNALEHVREQELFWFEINRILKVGGRIMISVPHHTCEGAYGTFGHRAFYNEDCIDSVVNEGTDPSVENRFILIKKLVSRGRFKIWQKREILWIVEKRVSVNNSHSKHNTSLGGEDE